MTKNAKKLPPETDWFPCSVKPVHVGMYKRESFNGNIVYSYWNGLEWFMYSTDIKTAMGYFNSRGVSVYQSLKWRGLTKEVKA